MTLDDLRTACLGKPGAAEEMPFGPDVLVFKVGGKIFALLSLTDLPPTVSLKCDPERAAELRAQYTAVAPGYHLNKRHWNTVRLGGDAPGALVRELIDHSYALVRQALPRAVREALP